MSNELLFFITIVASFSGVMLFYRLFGKVGLFAWMAFATIVANIETAKCVDMFGWSVTLGTILFSSNYLCTDILHEVFGGKSARNAVWISFAATIIFVGLEQLTLLFTPNDADFADGAMQILFGFMPRLCAASLISYLCSNMLDTYLYGWWSKRTERVWLRNNGSTFISQAVDTIIFTTLAFIGTMPGEVVLELIVTTYAIKVIVAICDTPFIYLAKRMGDSKLQLKFNS